MISNPLIENNVFHCFIGGMEENYVLTILNCSVFSKHPVEIIDISESQEPRSQVCTCIAKNFSFRCATEMLVERDGKKKAKK